MPKIIGTCSQFGGKDSGMAHTENLSLYWSHSQCDERRDLFYPRSEDLTEGTCHRLIEEVLYCAIRFDPKDKEKLRNTPIKVTNPLNEKFVKCILADWGPNENTGRSVDLSKGAMEALGVKTNDLVWAEFEID